MKITFNDATELTIQSASTRPDGSLLIKTISETEENLKTIFQDGMKTKKMIIKERESTIETYENFSQLEAIVKYTAGILGVVLYKSGETPEDKLEALKKENADLKESMDMLQGLYSGNVRVGISVMVTLLTNLFILLQHSGGKKMMAMLWAQQIMLGKKTYDQVPRLLKDKVKEILEDSGMGELVKEE